MLMENRSAPTNTPKYRRAHGGALYLKIMPSRPDLQGHLAGLHGSHHVMFRATMYLQLYVLHVCKRVCVYIYINIYIYMSVCGVHACIHVYCILVCVLS